MAAIEQPSRLGQGRLHRGRQGHTEHPRWPRPEYQCPGGADPSGPIYIVPVRSNLVLAKASLDSLAAALGAVRLPHRASTDLVPRELDHMRGVGNFIVKRICSCANGSGPACAIAGELHGSQCMPATARANPRPESTPCSGTTTTSTHVRTVFVQHHATKWK